MWPDGVVVLTPLLDEDLGLLEGGEDLPVEQFIPEACIEAFDIPVLPWRAWGDVGGLGANSSDPALTAPAMNSGPLSDLIYSGGPRRMNRSVRAFTTSVELSLDQPAALGPPW